MTKHKTVYATVNGVRIAATLGDDGTQALVYRVNGGTYGWYNVERFHGGRLTAATLTDFFTPKPVTA